MLQGHGFNTTCFTHGDMDSAPTLVCPMIYSRVSVACLVRVQHDTTRTWHGFWSVHALSSKTYAPISLSHYLYFYFQIQSRQHRYTKVHNWCIKSCTRISIDSSSVLHGHVRYKHDDTKMTSILFCPTVFCWIPTASSGCSGLREHNRFVAPKRF